jgi:hypothetical protein
VGRNDPPGNKPGISTRELLQRYLASPEARTTALEELTLRPSEAFEAALDFKGPYPEGANPVAVHEGPIHDLLQNLLRRFPQLLIGPDAVPRPSAPYLLISAAIAADDPRFADTILRGLEDRSIYMKLLVVDGIIRRPFLRTPSVKVRLEKLMATKSIARDRDALEHLQRALDSFESRPVRPG